MTDQAHMNAVLARLRERTSLASRTYDTRFPDSIDFTRGAYALVFIELLGPTDPRFSHVPSLASSREYVVTVRGVAPDIAGVRSVLQHAREQLVGVRVAPDGWRSDVIGLPESSEVSVDNNVNPSIAYADDEYTIFSRPSLLEVS